MNSTYVCEDCGREFEAHAPRRGYHRRFCDDCNRKRHLVRCRARNRKKSLHDLGCRSRWAQEAAEQRRAESAFRCCCGSKDPATFVWPTVHNGRAVVAEIRGQMSFAPHRLVHRDWN